MTKTRLVNRTYTYFKSVFSCCFTIVVRVLLSSSRSVGRQGYSKTTASETRVLRRFCFGHMSVLVRGRNSFICLKKSELVHATNKSSVSPSDEPLPQLYSQKVDLPLHSLYRFNAYVRHHHNNTI